MTTKYVTTEVEVEVDLSEFDTDEIIEELESRGAYTVPLDDETHELLEQIWLKRRMNQDFTKEIDQLLWEKLGKVL